MAITQLPSLDRTSASFRSDLNAFFAGLVQQFATEANDLAGALNAIAAGTAMAIPYTFSTTTTDADPGTGFLRLDNATQNAATTIRADLTGADGSTWTDVLNTFDDSTSTIKGHIMLQKLGDATKWILFAVTALASPTGYKNLTVSCVSSSAASPFADGDSLILKFTPKGDRGDTGSVAGAGDHEVVVHTGNGHGSTNTKIRRFTTTLTNVGTAITYADSAANGASFTINETGLYSLHYIDYYASGGSYMGASINSAQLATNVDSIAVASRLMLGSSAQAFAMANASRVVKLAAGDIVRAHTNGQMNAADNQCYFAIRKVGAV